MSDILLHIRLNHDRFTSIVQPFHNRFTPVNTRDASVTHSRCSSIRSTPFHVLYTGGVNARWPSRHGLFYRIDAPWHAFCIIVRSIPPSAPQVKYCFPSPAHPSAFAAIRYIVYVNSG